MLISAPIGTGFLLPPAVHLQILIPWGGGEREKKSFSLFVHLSARSLSNLNLPNAAGRGQTTELRGTNAAGQPWCHTRAVCGVPGAQTAHTVYASTCSEIRTEPPTAMNLTGMMWAVLFPDRDTLQNSALHPCPGDKIHLHRFSDRAPLQQIWGYTNRLAKKLISKTRNRLFWITKGSKMKPFIPMFRMNEKAE